MDWGWIELSAAMIARLSWLQPLATELSGSCRYRGQSAVAISRSSSRVRCVAGMATASRKFKVIDSHLHVWASSQESAEKYRYFPGQEPKLAGDAEMLLQNMEEAGVDGALIVQPINHMFDHSYVSSVLKQYPSKFVGCCLANPAEDGMGIKQLEDLITKGGYRAVRFNPALWQSGQLMTNEVGKAMFARAGELGALVGFLCMKGLSQYLSEIEELCTEFPSTPVMLDHLSFCNPPTNNEEEEIFSKLLNLSRFPQVHVKFSGLFRVSKQPYPYEDLSTVLSRVVSSYGANRVMWGSDFPYVIAESGYKEAKEAAYHLIQQAQLSPAELEWIMGRSVDQIFGCPWFSH